MECDICQRSHDAKRLPFLCAVDARNRLYEGRMNSAKLMLENDQLQTQVHEKLGHVTGDTTAVVVSSAKLQSQLRTVEERTDSILAAAEKLRADIQAARDEIQAKRALVAQRKSDLTVVQEGLTEGRTRQQDDVKGSVRKLEYHWSRTADDTAGTRRFLCREVARLYGLRRAKQVSPGHYTYVLGQIPLVDLLAMNSTPPDMISTSLDHVSRLVMLVAHYLAVRLPAEIVLPRGDNPHATIFNLASSYQYSDPSLTTSPGTMTPSAGTRSADALGIPRPRPLSVDKTLPQLSKEDPAAYSFFLEGVTLLAYNIAWLCNTQGVSIGDKASLDDVCNMGRNLYSLLILQYAPGHSNNAANLETATQASAEASWIGHFSHGSTFHSLSGHKGTDLVRAFKLPSPMKLADKLRKKLLGDAPAPDWEVLDDDAWKMEDGNEQCPTGNPDTAVCQGQTANGRTSSPRVPSNGWMKVKNR